MVTNLMTDVSLIVPTPIDLIWTGLKRLKQAVANDVQKECQ